MSINETLGHAANERGAHNEGRVLEAVERLATELDWISGGRKGTEEEDAAGVDVVVETDVGPLYLQVKSSKFGAGSFKEKRRRPKWLGVVVVGSVNDRALRRRVTAALHPLRGRAKKKRGG
jgi:hypothetical protein